MTDNQDARARLREHFLVPTSEHSKRWDALWKDGFAPWDRGQSSPALVDTLSEKRGLLGSPLRDDGQRKRALVPGCGKGYDVFLLASFGYDAYGLDVSENALKACKVYGETEFKGSSAEKSEHGNGVFEFIRGDFFGDEWREEHGLGSAGFDLIYDYTFFCALPPELRPAWAKRMTQLLAADGRLICLEFPTYKDPHTGGPPFGLKPEVYVAHLSHPGRELSYTAEGYPERSHMEDSPSSEGLTRLDHWQPERTHAIGQGKDWLVPEGYIDDYDLDP